MKSLRIEPCGSGGNEEIVVKIKKFKIVTKYKNVKYYRTHATHTVKIKTDLMQCLNKISHSGAQWVPYTTQETLEVLEFFTTEDEANMLKPFLHKSLDVMEVEQQ